MRNHIKKQFEALVGDWGKELTLSVLLDPRVKDFIFHPAQGQRYEAAVKYLEEEMNMYQIIHWGDDCSDATEDEDEEFPNLSIDQFSLLRR